MVQSGDTLFGIAIQYGVQLDELRRLNAGTLGPNDLLSIGQEIVISGTPITLPTPTPQPTEELTPEPQPTAESQPSEPAPGGQPAAPAATEGKSVLCVSAYHDRNTDLVWQQGEEELVPGAIISVLGIDGPSGSYTSDGISEPYCFQDLEPGNYVVRHTAPAGYDLSGPSEWGLILRAGESSVLNLGYVRGGGETPDEEAPEQVFEPGENERAVRDSDGTLLGTIITVSGIAALLLAIGVAVLFFLSRRGP